MFTLRISYPLSRLLVYILFTLSNTFMFNILVPVRTSDAVDFMAVNVVNGTVDVCFTNNTAYTYRNVSRRAIVNLLANPNMSLGFWINTNCINAKRVTVAHRYSYSSAAV